MRADRAERRIAAVSGRLRIGVALDTQRAPRWVARLLEEIERDETLELAAVIPVAPATAAAARAPLLWRLYERLDARLAPLVDDALEPVGGPAERAGTELDVLLDLGDAPLRSPVRTWRVAMVAGWPVSETVIFEGDRVVHRSRSAADPGSHRRGRSAQAYQAGFAVLRCLRRLQCDGATPAAGPPGQAVTPVGATGGSALRVVVRLAGGVIGRRIRRLVVRDLWALAVREARPLAGPVPDVRDGWRIVRPPLGRFYADPFVLERPEGAWLLFEEWRAEHDRARISWLPLPLPAGSPEPRPALELDHHLSYPFVFEHEGDVFMLPESAEARRLELWRAERLPDRWVRDTVLFDGVRMFDATVLERGGRWWLWATVAADGAPVTNDVSLFFADTPRGPWTEHPASPVSSDVRGSRPAGPLFEHDGRLIRPAQDSTGAYGRAIVLHEVLILTPEAYEEVEAGGIEPAAVFAGNRATHTYGRSAHHEVVDVQVRTRVR